MTLKLYSRLGASTLGLALALAAAGCGSNEPVGGLTNPNAGSVVDRDKGAVRTDLPVPDMNPGNKEPVAEAAPSSTSGSGIASGSDQPGPDGNTRQTSPEAASSVPANPTAKQKSGDASGGTKPSGPIKEGTPRSPQ